MTEASMTIEIFSSMEGISRYALHEIIITAENAVNDRGVFSLVLSGGSTPEPLFKLFKVPPITKMIPWDQTHLFWADERRVPPDEDGSNYGQARRLFIDRLGIPSKNIHRMKGELSSKEAEVDYRNQLAKFSGFLSQSDLIPRFDLVLLGMGSDGHTASLFPEMVPAEAKTEIVVAVTADYDGRPANRITMTPKLINRARKILFLVTGESKASAVSAVLTGFHQPDQYPAQLIQPSEGEITWLLDQQAASLLA